MASTFVEGKVVVITGSGAGIGRDMAQAFAAHGARVVVNDPARDKTSGEDVAQRVVDEIRQAGGEAVASLRSVATWDDAHAIVQQAMDTWGRIDCVVNNAGVLRDRFFFNMNEEEWRTVVDVHLHGSFFVARAAAPHFKAQASGSYVHMTSAAGLFGNTGQANYASAKMALLGLSRTIAVDMARYNVRSNCIGPWAWTAMTASIPTDTPEQKAYAERLKTMEARKIAPLAIYLASDGAAHVSGQVFGVRANEIYFFSQPRVLRSAHTRDGWTPETIAETVMPAFQPHFFPVDRASALTPWAPI